MHLRTDHATKIKIFLNGGFKVLDLTVRIINTFDMEFSA